MTTHSTDAFVYGGIISHAFDVSGLRHTFEESLDDELILMNVWMPGKKRHVKLNVCSESINAWGFDNRDAGKAKEFKLLADLPLPGSKGELQVIRKVVHQVYKYLMS